MQRRIPQLNPLDRPADPDRKTAAWGLSGRPLRWQQTDDVSRSVRRRSGLSRLDVLVVIIVAGVLAALLIPAVRNARVAARLNECQDSLRLIGTGLSAYHSTYQSLPPAGLWTTRNLRSLALHQSQRHDLFVEKNWAVLLLPFTDDPQLSGGFGEGILLADEENRSARLARPDWMVCPDDDFNHSGNPYVFQPSETVSVEYARGNYAINGGPQPALWDAGSTTSPKTEHSHLEIDLEARRFQAWGSGIAGFNRSFSWDDCSNGLSTLVAVDEIRSGVHALDPRGVWSLGHIASSVTWGHGVTGDCYGPNNQWGRSDDIQGCGTLHDTLGTQTLLDLEMPCVSYVDANQQSTARSRHAGGVNVLFADGRARFIRNEIDPGLWHVMHARETPVEVLESGMEFWLDQQDFAEAPSPSRVSPAVDEQLPATLENSIGMKFVRIPAGTFTMGVPDEENYGDPPPECPPHQARITRAYLLGVHEVTQAQFAEVTSHNPAWHTSDRLAADNPGAEAVDPSQFPVEQVTWHDAVDFCRRLSELPAEKAARRIYRLPTEAEWEYACRSGSSEPYVWQKNRKDEDLTGEAAGILPPLPVTPVGRYAPNAFGLYDMRGNVWEWCADWFDRDYYVRSPGEDPRGPEHGFLKVVRGGDWCFVGEVCRINYPVAPPNKQNAFIGFRVGCDIRSPKAPD